MGRRAGALIDAPLRLVRAFAAANLRLTIVTLGAGALSGALLPLFMLATGALVGAVRAHHSPTFPLAVVVCVFVLERVLDPLREELGQALWRQVDQSLTERVMSAMARPPGLAHVEDPAVRDKLVQAQGTIQPDGSFELGVNIPKEGAPAGKYRVLINPGDMSDLDAKVRSGFDRRYTDFDTSGLEFEVKPGKNEFPIQLTRRGRAGR